MSSDKNLVTYTTITCFVTRVCVRGCVFLRERERGGAYSQLQTQTGDLFNIGNGEDLLCGQ